MKGSRNGKSEARSLFDVMQRRSRRLDAVAVESLPSPAAGLPTTFPPSLRPSVSPSLRLPIALALSTIPPSHAPATMCRSKIGLTTNKRAVRHHDHLASVECLVGSAGTSADRFYSAGNGLGRSGTVSGSKVRMGTRGPYKAQALESITAGSSTIPTLRWRRIGRG
jgi:hypothetical protein